ncbi:hypothetical protein AOC25_06860 [Polynucleobacter asymbioticus]|jgi:hypothetical protein|uniref:Uncharacterized protein n=1 Tax=Polynucleobacter asymbioticus TaxID=576611 RepID=A0AAC9IY59_9BURK|nr:hypothetical protein AOC25_06860 [Polynucleobacter asymbioticus]
MQWIGGRFLTLFSFMALRDFKLKRPKAIPKSTTLGGVMEFIKGCVFGLIAFGIPTVIGILV